MKLTVELRPHIGLQQTDFGPVEVEHDQYMVFVSGETTSHPVQMGYVGKALGAPFNGLETFAKLPQVLQTDIVAQINAKLGGTRKVGVPVLDEPEEESEDIEE